MDRRKVPHFETGNAQEEARSLFDLTVRKYGSFAMSRLGIIRMEIMVTREDRALLELLIEGGLLDRTEVQAAIHFREQVAKVFDQLVEEAIS